MRRFLKLRYAIVLVAGVVVFMSVHDRPQPMNEVYHVQPGDTLWGIASHYNGGEGNTEEVIYNIEQANNMSDAMIHPGDSLKVPSPSAP